MATWRYTIIFEAGKYGWTESYYRTEDNARAVFVKGGQLAQKRIALCGDGIQMPYHRVSDVATFRDFGINTLGLSSTGVSVPETKTTVDKKADKPYSSLLMGLYGPQLDGPYRGHVFLRGVPDDEILGDDPLNLTTAYKSLFTDFRNKLVNDGWLMKQQARFAPDVLQGKITAISAGPPAVISTLTTGGLLDGDQVSIRGVKGLDPSTPVRGVFTIANPITATSFAIPGLVTIGTYKGGGVWRKVQTVYIPITDAAVLREVSRKTGGPFAKPVGRRRTKKAA